MIFYLETLLATYFLPTLNTKPMKQESMESVHLN
jgi:hypothetical protein